MGHTFVTRKVTTLAPTTAAPTTAAPTTAAPTTAAPTTDECFNDLSFAFKDQAKKTCQWIQTPGKEKRRQKLCLYDDVRAACPNTCGLCCGDDPETEFGWSSKKRLDNRNM